jgi:hypothetical protein
MDLETWLKLPLFMALVCACALHGLAASGHFPREHRAPSLRSPAGAALLFGTMAVAAVAALAGIAIAVHSFPWYATVIGAGLVLLAIPLLLRPFPDHFVNGSAALLTFAAAATVFAVLLAAL